MAKDDLLHGRGRAGMCRLPNTRVVLAILLALTNCIFLVESAAGQVEAWFVKPLAVPISLLGSTTVNVHGSFDQSSNYVAEIMYEADGGTSGVFQTAQAEATYLNETVVTVSLPQLEIEPSTSISIRLLNDDALEDRAARLFNVQLYASPNVTNVIALGTDSVTMYGGPLITLNGHFDLTADVPALKFQLDDLNLALVMPATQSSNEVVRFIMQPFILPLEERVAEVSVWFALNGRDFEDTQQTFQVTADFTPLKVCFMFFNELGSEQVPGWTEASNFGKLTLEAEFHSSIQTSSAFPVQGAGNARNQTLKFAREGCRVIIGAHITHRKAYQALAGTEFENSGIKFVLGGEKSDPLATPDVGLCFPKLFESRYLTGMVAGHMTKSNIIGYVVAIRIPQTIRQINAFTMGVRAVNPNATVVMFLTGSFNSFEIDPKIGRILLHMGADIVTQHTNGLALQELFHAQDKFSIGVWSNYAANVPRGDLVLTSALNEWGPCYVKYTEAVLFDDWKPNQVYFEGMKDGYTEIAPFSIRVPLEVQAEVLAKKAEFMEGLEIFCGGEDGMFDQEGNPVIPPGKCLNNAELEDKAWMDWLTTGIDFRGLYTDPGCNASQISRYDENGNLEGCFECPAGMIKDEEAEDTCMCMAGTFSNLTTGACEMCPLGHYQPLPGQTSCLTCKPGFISASPGAVECTACDTNSYNPDFGASECVACPPLQTAAFFAASSVEQCVCTEGSFLSEATDSNERVCLPCPVVVTSAHAVNQATGERRNCSRIDPCLVVQQRDTVTLQIANTLQGNRAAAGRCGITDASMELTPVGSLLSGIVVDGMVVSSFDVDPFVRTELPLLEGPVQDRLYEMNLTKQTTGMMLLQVALNEANTLQADFSPLAFQVEARVCPEGERLVIADGSCVSSDGDGLDTALLITIAVLASVLILAVFLATLYFKNKEVVSGFWQEQMMYRRPPVVGQYVTIVVTDIEGSTSLWDQYPQDMHAALGLHDALMRRTIPEFHGFELLTEGDSFHVAFHKAQDAVRWCVAVQLRLHATKWNAKMVEVNKHDTCDAFNGLRVRMGVHTGMVEATRIHPNTKRVQYVGKVLNTAKAIEGVANGAQILVNMDTVSRMDPGLLATDAKAPARLVHLGAHTLNIKVDARDQTISKTLGDRENYRRTRLSRSSITEVSLPSADQAAVEEVEDTRTHELIMVTPLALVAREDHLPRIATERQVLPSYFEAPVAHSATLVQTEVEGLNLLESRVPDSTASSLIILQKVMRRLLQGHNGYVCQDNKQGAMLLAFHSAVDAVQYSLELQEQLLLEAWPGELLDEEQACRMALYGCVIFRGLRVRVGIAAGQATEVKPSVATGAAEYVGLLAIKCMRLMTAAHGGQVLVGRCVQEALNPYVVQDLGIKVNLLGKFQLKGTVDEEVYQASTGLLLLRPFPPVKLSRSKKGKSKGSNFFAGASNSDLRTSMRSSSRSLAHGGLDPSDESVTVQNFSPSFVLSVNAILAGEEPPAAQKLAPLAINRNESALSEALAEVDSPPPMSMLANSDNAWSFYSAKGGRSRMESQLETDFSTQIVYVCTPSASQNKFLKLILKKIGLSQVHTFTNSTDLLTQHKKVVGNHILMASVTQVDGLDGASVARMLRHRIPHHMQPSIIMMVDDEDQSPVLLDSGVTKVLLKPVSADDLMMAVKDASNGAQVRFGVAALTGRWAMEGASKVRQSNPWKSSSANVADGNLVGQTATLADINFNCTTILSNVDSTTTYFSHTEGAAVQISVLLLLADADHLGPDGETTDPFMALISKAVRERDMHRVHTFLSSADTAGHIQRELQISKDTTQWVAVVVDARGDLGKALSRLNEVRDSVPKQHASRCLVYAAVDNGLSEANAIELRRAGAVMLTSEMHSIKMMEMTIMMMESYFHESVSTLKMKVLLSAADKTQLPVEVLDSEFYFQYANPAALELSGYSLKGVSNQTLSMQMALPNKFSTMKSGLRTDSFWQGELLSSTKSGSQYSCIGTIWSAVDMDTQTIFYILIRTSVFVPEEKK
eukprot:CAMPEP_0118928276 /NCGR_PEP_ID=MMETSP1169-20130426/5554_1 /TAXON_ID=36882 /ORGANISM="Pyramimonas obovata, Strain CCMP722" /LENGTH=2032 /DNA_ID=CAMNT_0006870203 /DNA_START=97 /DNA_END=6195 /DNA_ORIENTATION=-